MRHFHLPDYWRAYVWGIGQLATGTWSDPIGRKPLNVWGMWLQAARLAAVAIYSGVIGTTSGSFLSVTWQSRIGAHGP
jgi:hypothetical protein